MQFTPEELKDAFDKSNPKIQKIIQDSWITKDVALIGKNFNLRIDKIDMLTSFVGFVVLNLIPISKLISVIEKEIGLEKEKAGRIAEKIDEIVFSRIRKEIQQKEESTNPEQEKIMQPQMENTEEENNMPENIPEEEKSFSQMFNQNQTEVSEEKNIDIYQELI